MLCNSLLQYVLCEEFCQLLQFFQQICDVWYGGVALNRLLCGHEVQYDVQFQKLGGHQCDALVHDVKVHEVR